MIFLEEIPADAPAVEAYNADELPPGTKAAPAANARPTAATAPPALKTGARVRIHGLAKAPKFNGRLGTVMSEASDGRHTVQIDGESKRFRLRAVNLTPEAGAATPADNAKAAALTRMHAAVRAGIFDACPSQVRSRLYATVFSYVHPEWRDMLGRCNPESKLRHLSGRGVSESSDARRALWAQYTRKILELSNEGLPRVYDALRKERRGRSGRDARVLFEVMQRQMGAAMARMVGRIARDTRENLSRIWELYVPNPEKNSAGDEKKEMGLGQSDFACLCKDHLDVEKLDVASNGNLIVQQALINATKPLEVMADDKSLVARQIADTKAQVHGRRAQIIREHAQDVQSKMDKIDAYAEKIFRAVAGKSQPPVVTREAFLDRYLFARADIQSEQQQLESHRYNKA